MAKNHEKQPAAPAYKIVGVLPGLISFKGQNYDLSKLDDKELAQLHKQGVPYVQPVDKESL